MNRPGDVRLSCLCVRTAALALAGLSALTLSACGSSATTPGDAPAGSGGRGTGGMAGSAGAAGASDGAGGNAAAGGASDGAGGTSGGGAAPTDAGSAAGGGSGSTGLSLSGTWVSEVQTMGLETVPLVGPSNVKIDLVFRLFSTESAGRVSFTFDVCRLQSVTFPDPNALKTTFTPAVLATFTTTAAEDTPALSLGGAAPLPPFTILSGVDGAQASVDADQDGHPGVTIPTDVGNGWLKADGYVGITIASTFTATLTGDSTLTGTADFSANGTIFGSTNPVLTSGQITVVPTSKATPFSATRLPGNVACSDVLPQFPAP